ncbi:UNVERIFIED_CONTAM: hypothetical protein Sindi_0066500, partial [Sesamum indicum]
LLVCNAFRSESSNLYILSSIQFPQKVRDANHRLMPHLATQLLKGHRLSLWLGP